MSTLRSRRSLAALLVLLAIIAAPAMAQKFTGDIEGNITDSSGAAMPGATVTVRSLATSATRATTTSDIGAYRVPDLDVGAYEVTVAATGFKTQVRQVEVTSNGVAALSFTMEVGEATEKITVTAEAPLTDLSVTQSTTLENQQIENIPLDGRDYSSLVALTPGVQRAPGGGFLAININGTRATSQNNLIDGLYNNDRFYGQPVIGQTGVLGVPATLIPMEALQEVNIQETPSAQFAVKGGAPISLVLKNGTNQWHGSGLFLRHTSFADADNYFSTSTGCQPGSCSTPFRDMQGTATIGGPIIKDKTFFFGYYDGQGYSAIIPHLATVPTPTEITQAMNAITTAGLTPTVAGQNLLSFYPTTATGVLNVRIPAVVNMTNFGIVADQKIGPRNTLTGRYVFGDSTQSAPPTEINSTAIQPASQYNAALFNSVAPTRGQLVGLSETWAVSSNKSLESRLGWTRFSQIIKTNNSIDPKSLGVDTGPIPATQDLGMPYVHLAAFFSSIGGGGALNYPIVTRPDETVDWSEHFSWVRGNHSIELGGNFQHAYTNFSHDQARVQFQISADPNPADEIEELLLGEADSASRYFGNTHRHFTQNTYGLYIQDAWKVRPRLTLTLGLRYDINGVVREENNLAANFLPSVGLVQVGHGISSLYNVDPWNFGPRVGFAWDVFGNGTTAVRGGYTLSYDTPEIATFALPFLAFENNPGAFLQPNLRVTQEILAGLAPLTFVPPTAGGSCLNPNTGAAGDYVCFDDATAGPVFGTNPGGLPPFSAFAIQRNLKTPKYHQFNLGIQQEFWHQNVLTVSYSGQRGYNLILPIDINAFPVGCGITVIPCARPYASVAPNLSDIVEDTNLGWSRYDSLQASLRQRRWHGLNMRYNFTWGKCFDYNSSDRIAGPQLNNPLDIKGQRGLCDADVRLNFNVAGMYDFPAVPHLARFGSGWALSSVFTAESGRPFSVVDVFDPSGQGLPSFAVRADWDGTPIHINSRQPSDYVEETYTAVGQADPCGYSNAGAWPLSPFYIPCPGTVGNSRRNQLIGPGLSQWDMALIKNTKITEGTLLQFRWEVYNVINRANFGAVTNFLIPGAPIFGTITGTPDVSLGNPVLGQGASRNMDFVLKLTF
ncbi:MAG: TonB-dependent receptor [Candidatus Acidiferrales bacterium]|jgi:outer membrane receptor protein involved in Fe transport